MNHKKIQNFFLASIPVLSGLVSVLYELIWFRWLYYFFGSGTQAAMIVLAVFFCGMGLGALVWKFIGKKYNPWQRYVLVEIVSVISALGVGLIWQFAHSSTLFQNWEIVIALCSAMVVTAIAMGGFFPVFGIARMQSSLPPATMMSVYMYYTLGGVCAVLAMGLWLLPTMGGIATYGIAVGLHLLLVLIIALNSRSLVSQSDTSQLSALPWVKHSGAWLLAGFSGLLTMSLELILFACLRIIFPSDVYIFTIAMGLFMLGLACAARLAKKIARRHRNIDNLMFGVLIGSGIAVTVGLTGIGWLSNNWQPVIVSSALYNSVTVWGIGLILVAVVCVVGLVFPLLLQYFSQHKIREIDLGLWSGVNALGGSIGIMITGMWLFRVVGVVGAGAIVIIAYAFLLVWYSWSTQQLFHRLLLVGMSVVVLTGCAWFVATHVASQMFSEFTSEELQAVYYSSDGPVAVIEQHPLEYPIGITDRYVTVSKRYVLGGVGSTASEARQMHLPLLLHQRPTSVFVLGLGTGITASAALSYPLERIVVAEIIPEVVTAAKDFFSDQNHELFTDERVEIVAQDGRFVLQGRAEQFDVIVLDLLNPYADSVGYVYSQENFTLIADRLTDDGLAVVWLPAYQLTAASVGSIVATFNSVFEHVTIWRGNFDPTQPIIGLVGTQTDQSLQNFGERVAAVSMQQLSNTEAVDLLLSTKGLSLSLVQPGLIDAMMATIEEQAATLPYTWFIADAHAVGEYFSQFPILTNDKPLLEYQFLATRNDPVLRLADMTTWIEQVQSFEYPRITPLVDERLQQAGTALFLSGVLAAQASLTNQPELHKESERVYSMFELLLLTSADGTQ